MGISTSQGGDTPVTNYGNSIVYSMTATTTVVGLTEGTADLDTESQIDTDTYSTSSGVITVKETGTYLIINHAAVDDNGGANRSAAETFLHINSTLVAGAYTDGFIRRSGNSNEFSDCGYGIYELTANDTVEMRALLINQAGSNCQLTGNDATNIDAKTSLTLVKLNSDNSKIILEALSGQTQQLTANVTDVDMNWDSSIVKDTGFTHSTSVNPDEITIDEAGTYMAVYSNSWQRTSDSTTRTGAIERLTLDGTTIPGTFHNNYVRGSQSSELIRRGNNSSATIFKTTSPNQVLKLVSYREAGAITLYRYPLKSRITVYKLNGNEKTFRIESNSVENIGSTTESTMTYDSSDWVDSGLSLSSNQITATSGSKFLVFQGVQSDGSAVQRTGAYQFGRFNGTNVKIGGTATKYVRHTGDMDIGCPHWGVISTIGDGETIECRMDNLCTTSTDLLRITNTGAFVGIDLNTLE